MDAGRELELALDYRNTRNPDSFKQLIEPHFKTLINYIRKQVRRNQRHLVDPEDMVMMAIEDLNTQLLKKDGTVPRYIFAYLLAQATRHAKNTIQSFKTKKRSAIRNRQLGEIEVFDIRELLPEDAADRQEKLKILARILRKTLSKQEETVICGVVFHGTHVNEAARVLGISRKVVAGLKKRGLKKLRKLLQTPEGQELEALRL